MSQNRFSTETRAQRMRPGVWAVRLACLAMVPTYMGSAWAAPKAKPLTTAQRVEELERKLAQSMQQVEALTQRLAQMEAAKAAAGADKAAALPAAEHRQLVAIQTAQAEQIKTQQQQINDQQQAMSALINKPEPDRGIDMHGFADVGFVSANKGRVTGAQVGALNFYLMPKFGDRVKSLFELAMEVGGEGEVGVDLERAQIGYTVNDEVTVWAGRFHTPYGYWNTAFHHGAQIQTSIKRPSFLDFEDAGGIVPAHTVGVWASGASKLDAGRLSYDVYLGNAPTVNLSDPSATGSGTLNPGLHQSAHRNASLGGNLGYTFKGSLNGLSLGGHVYSASVGDDAANPSMTRVRMFGTWTVYNENDWEAMAETYFFRNSNGSADGTHSSRAGYAQLGKDVGGWTPFVRYEFTRLDQTDPYFAQQASGYSYARWVGGLRFDINPKTALKLEGNHTRVDDRGAGSYTEFRTQLAVRF